MLFLEYDFAVNLFFNSDKARRMEHPVFIFLSVLTSLILPFVVGTRHNLQLKGVFLHT